MADFNQINQFGSAKRARSSEGMSCAECEAMLTDAIDETLSDKDRAAFDLHISTCADCSRMLADAKRGAALLEMLKQIRPEPSSLLVNRILAQTSGLPGETSIGQITGEASAPVFEGLGLNAVNITPETSVAGVTLTTSIPGQAGNVIPFRSRVAGKFNIHAIGRAMLQPRLAMTAAMAFFSIALTMNLTGVHLSGLKASDLKPSNLKHSFYQADASVVRYYDNLRVVYELESKVRDLRRLNESDDTASPAKTSGKDDAADDAGKDKSGKDPEHKPSPKAGSGTSQRNNPLLPEFKLAVEHPDRSLGLGQDQESNVAVLDGAVLQVNTDKLKDALQEGGLV